MARKNNKCYFEECILPSNNNRYFLQLFFLILGLVYLLKDSREFTFVTIFMYTTPILIDLISVKLNSRFFNHIKAIFVIFNSIIILFCISGLFGVIEDKENYFSIVSTAVAFAEIKIEKKILLISMVVELSIPIILYFGSPTRRTNEILEIAKKRKAVST